MTHPFRPVEAPERPFSPSWSIGRLLPAVARAGHLRAVAGLFRLLVRAVTVGRVLLVVGVLVQVVLLLSACYVIDLAVSLMELWAELARKHLELTT